MINRKHACSIDQRLIVSFAVMIIDIAPITSLMALNSLEDVVLRQLRQRVGCRNNLAETEDRYRDIFRAHGSCSSRETAWPSRRPSYRFTGRLQEDPPLRPRTSVRAVCRAPRTPEP